MKCPRCYKDTLTVFKTFRAGVCQTQERRCTHCKHISTYVITQHEGDESAYLLARKLKAQDDKKQTDK